MSTEILVVAGEVSGDIHGANLVQDLMERYPDMQVSAVCGERLRETGARCVAGTEELAHMGLVEVLRELPRIRALMRRLVDHARDVRPDLAILIDSPDFNLRLARRLNRLGVPVLLYVSPQLWAWRKGRVRQVRRWAREVLCILPFETEFYRRHGVPAQYVGHPLVDDLDRQGLLGGTPERVPGRLALLPGSRAMEVRSLLPAMLQSVERLNRNLVSEVVLIEAPGISGVVDEVISSVGRDPRVERIAGERRRLELARSEAAVTASGTATLECALLDVPMIVGYRLNPLSWWLAKRLVRVPHVALVNLILQERAAPELLQNDWQPEALSEAVESLLRDGGAAQRTALRRARTVLGGPGASKKAAEAVAAHFH